MGGDTPLDIEGWFEERFGKSAPSAEESLSFLTSQLNERSWDATSFKQVTAFLLIQRAAPMHDEVRRLALEGCVEEDTSSWNDPDERDTVLAQFAEIIKAYPAEGGRVELPHQPGLFEKIMELR